MYILPYFYKRKGHTNEKHRTALLSGTANTVRLTTHTFKINCSLFKIPFNLKLNSALLKTLKSKHCSMTVEPCDSHGSRIRKIGRNKEGRKNYIKS